MSGFFLIFACAISVGALLRAEARQNVPLKWIAKPFASLCFLLLALTGGALDSAYGLWLLTALIFCFIGDVFLIRPGQTPFLAGMGAFALGHGAYIAAFQTGAGEFSGLTFAAAGGAIISVVVALGWLWPHLQALKWPVAGYAAVIAAMVAASFAAAPPQQQTPYWPVILGAVGFAASDLSVARDQFISRDFTNKLWGLPLYYGAQLLLASSV